MKKVLYVGLKWNYGKKEEDTSFEYRNIEAGIKECADVTCWHPDEPSMSEDELLELVPKFDCIFHTAFNETLDLPESVARLAMRIDIPVVQWDCDASWRFHNWILPHRKDRASHFITTHSSTVGWYEKCGMNVIKSQWAGSPMYVGKPDTPKLYDVGFAGQKHGIRTQLIEVMAKAGFDVHVFGHYWEDFPNSHPHTPQLQQMIDVLDASKICLNLSNPWHVGTMPQIKGRHFEIPQVGGFQLTTTADNLDEYFVPDKEIIVVHSAPDLIERSLYYLDHEDERLAIAKAGQERVLRDHQWKHRFEDIFNEIGI
jgi:hypothetical protein